MTWERTAAATTTASADRVWDTLLDGRRWSAWNPGVEWMTLEGPLAPGNLLTMKPKGAPQTAFRIAAAIPGRLLDLVVTFGPLAAMELRWEIAPRDGGAQIAQSIRIRGPFAGLLLRRAASRIARGMQANVERLAARAASPG